ncbi:MAG TPA: DUF1223 domain-containing protein [Anaeromyxobacter sp.]|nr:DUF1223 domain-containing protein [Anaeromyxobacter sp.]
MTPFAAAALAALLGQTPAQPTLVLVELFTSEGCSSCPPADRLLSLLGREGLPGVRVLGLSEHVDYWDELGWRDPFGSRQFTERQESYLHRLQMDSVYTPQAVVDGVDQVVGADFSGLRQAILRAARLPHGRLSLSRTADGVRVEGRWPGGRARVWVALLEDGLQSRVERGENAGRTLHHDGVVRFLGVAGEGDGVFRGTAVLPRRGSELLRAVAFAQAPGGRVLASGELVYPPPP